MQSREGRPKMLLVPAALHPLRDGVFPGNQFGLHLALAKQRADELIDQGVGVEIYVPGSRHRVGDVADDISLSQAGAEFLGELGVHEDAVVRGEELSDYYKGEAGVYNSGDEAFVAAAYFKDNEAFGGMEVICSPDQAERWQLMAVANGVLPQQTVAGGVNSATDLMTSYTYRIDPTWQHARSPMGALSRRLRVPKE